MIKRLPIARLNEIENLGVISNILYRNNRVSFDVNDLIEKLTISKMIEILYEYDCDILIESSGSIWYVSVAGHIDTEDEELIYALWKAIKIIIKQ